MNKHPIKRYVGQPTANGEKGDKSRVPRVNLFTNGQAGTRSRRDNPGTNLLTYSFKWDKAISIISQPASVSLVDL